VKYGKGCHIWRHGKSNQDEKGDYADLIRPEQLNVLADHRATTALDTLRAVGQTTEVYPPTEATFVTPPGISPVAKYARTLRTELPEYEL
jgi:hypothetical protein